jgi:hypothetical protein
MNFSNFTWHCASIQSIHAMKKNSFDWSIFWFAKKSLIGLGLQQSMPKGAWDIPIIHPFVP